jgi:type IV pilus assembly protein PilY1
MGFTTSSSAVVPMVHEADSEWYLILGSGPTTSDGISTQTGKVAAVSLKKLVNKDVGLQIPDALPSGTEIGRFLLDAGSFVSDPITLDYDLNFMADAVYFGTVSGDFGSDGLGDWGGKLYRLVTLEKYQGEQILTQPSDWATLLLSGNPRPLLNAGRPVTAAPSVGWDGSDFWVFFGTGRLFERKDKNDVSFFTYYGIKEPRVGNEFTWEEVEDLGAYNATPGARGLLEVSDIKVAGAPTASASTLSCKDGTDACLKPATGPEFSTFTGLQEHIGGRDGWWRELDDPGERNLGEAALLGGLLIFTTYIPSTDLCTTEGDSFLYGLYYKTGTAWHRSVFSDTTDPADVTYRMDIGKGLVITPNLVVTDKGVEVVLQTSTGAMPTIDLTNLPIQNSKSGRSSWQEVN